jgi:hypothetical protein
MNTSTTTSTTRALAHAEVCPILRRRCPRLVAEQLRLRRAPA